MNDFLRDLETELTAASRRRSARRARPWWRRPPVPSARPAVVIAAAAALLAIVLGVAVAARRDGDERSAQPAPSPSATPLSALSPVRSCAAEAPRAGADVGALAGAMAVFRRPQMAPDGLALPSGSQFGDVLSSLPLAGWAPAAVRQPGLGVLMHFQLLPGIGAAGVPGCAERRSGREPVVCLLAVPRRRPVGARCFTPADVRRGRALAMIDPSGPTVGGVVPDGVQLVELHWAGRAITTPVVENAFQARLPGAAVGTPVGVTFGDSNCRTAATPPELRSAVPALALQSHGDTLPPSVLRALARRRAITAAEARLVTSAKHVRFWAVPAGQARCGDGRVEGAPDQACALAATTEQLLGLACAGAREIARGALTYADRGGGDVLAVGLAPPGTYAAVVATPKGTAILAATEGVVGGFLPAGVTLGDLRGAKVTYRRSGTPAADAQSVVVLDAAGDGRDAAVADRLARLARGTAAEGDVVHGVATLDPRARSAVEYLPVGIDKARRVAGLLGIRDVRPLEKGVPTGGAAVVVIAGRDVRMR